jgi:hypothetical protein
MATIISRRHPLKFYLSLLVATIFFVGMGVAVISIIAKNSPNGMWKPRTYPGLAFAMALFPLAFYTVFRYFKNAPVIRIDSNSIAFNSKSFLLSDIREIELTGKQDFPYLISYPMEAAKIQFNDGQTKFIFDDMYANAAELKYYLKQLVIDKKDFTLLQNFEISPSEAASEHYETFKGNQFFSLRGLVLWGFFAIILYSLLTKRAGLKPQASFFIVSILLFWIALHSWMMHFFEVSNNFFLVRNHIRFWKKKIYRLTDIKEVAFETRNNMPNCLFNANRYHPSASTNPSQSNPNAQ